MKKIHINPQSKGSLGKSFETECRTAWLDAIGIPWYGYDLDDRHRTFRNKHPKNVELVEFDNEPKEAILKMIQETLNRPEPVVFVDCKAQSDLLLRTSFDSLSIFEHARNAGAEFVISLFPSDDNESMTNLGHIIQWGYDGGAQFLIVRNPKQAKATQFQSSDMRKTLIDIGAIEIDVLTLMAPTMRMLEKFERDRKRGIPFGEFASGMKGVFPSITSDMVFLLRHMAKQYNAIAPVLLPEEELGNVPQPEKESAFRKMLNVSL